jgi:hypothetical protein
MEDGTVKHAKYAKGRRDNKMNDHIRFCRDNRNRTYDFYCRIAVTTFGHEGHDFSSSRVGGFANTNWLTGHVQIPTLGYEIMAA